MIGVSLKYKKIDMKREFTKQYILDNKGCYNNEQVNAIPCINNETITLKDLFNDIPIINFTWFFVKKCELTNRQKQDFALHCAKAVLPIYEAQYPNYYRVRECVESTERYLNGDVTLGKHIEHAANAAADAAANAYAYAACAAADAAYAANATYADADAANAAANAVYATNAANAASEFKKSVLEFIEKIK